jgi:uncharacterized lipoprotein YddW (UPF0748 family)
MEESRAILDEGLSWVTHRADDQAAHRLCRRVKRAGFNVIVPNVWHGRGTTWPSDLAPWDDRFPRPAGWDPFARLLETARTYDLQVHPWFTLGLRQRAFYPEFAADPSSEGFDFHNPAFRDFIVKVVLDVVERYPVHGINLDFVRFDYPKPGFEEEQEAAVRKVLQSISTKARALNRALVISVDAAPWHPTITQFGQNAPKWADEGLIDVIYSMQYMPSPDFEIIRRIQSRMKRPEAMVVTIGNYDHVGQDHTTTEPRDPERVVTLIREARKISARNGVAVYMYSYLSDEQVDMLRKTVFAGPAKPSWSTRSAPSKGPGIQ